jgi:hypothetical protein
MEMDPKRGKAPYLEEHGNKNRADAMMKARMEELELN